jgi:hypothetical protein
LALLCGCGPEAVLWVKVEAPLVVPKDCDGLRLQVTRGSSTGTSVFDRHFTLTNTQFPLTVTLTTSDAANVGAPGLDVQATALLGGAPAASWAYTSGTAVLTKDRTSELDLKMSAPY